MDKLRVGYIGLGAMGKPMALNILKAGFPLTVFNRTAEKAGELLTAGAEWADSPADLARRSDVVFTNVSNTADVLSVVLGQSGVREGVRPGMIFVDNSTISPTGSREIYESLRALGVSALDAPVSGGEIGAQNGSLTIMVGGDAESLELVRPILNAVGKKITHIGGAGAGQIAKAANQIMVAAQMVAEAELMIFAQKAGADPVKVIEAIKGGAAQCWTLDVKPQRLFAGNRTPGFKASLQAKDLAIVMETAQQSLMSLPGTAVSAQLFNALCAMGEGNLDNSAVIRVIELLNNEELQTA
ncbi:MAG TPA: NAD(P)-dependent oxidoreductase [Anaerolineaceae bacterium]|nr:NAD(P)-dependent oxidoreductase [Anaerolineaceae bacterium]HPT23090.1 NAD(P)-dependent oxidoreductase [Anaerolineaceae bacterium]